MVCKLHDMLLSGQPVTTTSLFPDLCGSELLLSIMANIQWIAMNMRNAAIRALSPVRRSSTGHSEDSTVFSLLFSGSSMGSKAQIETFTVLNFPRREPPKSSPAWLGVCACSRSRAVRSSIMAEQKKQPELFKANLFSSPVPAATSGGLSFGLAGDSFNSSFSLAPALTPAQSSPSPPRKSGELRTALIP